MLSLPNFSAVYHSWSIRSSCQGGTYLAPAHSSSSEKCSLSAQTWIHSWVTLDYEVKCDWGCSSGFLTLVLGLLSCCRAEDGCNIGTAGVTLTRCSTLSRCLRGGVAQCLTWDLSTILIFFLLPCRGDLSWCLWYFSIEESGFSWGQQAGFFSPCSRFIWISDSSGCQQGCSEFC